MENEDFLVEKASGELVPFSKEKLFNSLKRAGASHDMCNRIFTQMKAELHDKVSTKTIYKLAFALLRKHSRSLAGRYKLKRAIMELGPSGFPFEIYVSEIFKRSSYDVEVGKIVRGNCVNHEIDVIALNSREHLMIECKFHNTNGFKCNVKIPLYIWARFLDVEKSWQNIPGHDNLEHQAWIVTNTRFSEDAEQYGQCVGIHLMSWDFPCGRSLKERIEELGLHPITCIPSLKKSEIQTLFDKGIVLCQSLCDSPGILKKMGVPPGRQNKILVEASSICQMKNPSLKFDHE